MVCCLNPSHSRRTLVAVYPDSPSATAEQCTAAQVAAITGALDFLTARPSLTPAAAFIESVNTQYEHLHRAFEEQCVTTPSLRPPFRPSPPTPPPRPHLNPASTQSTRSPTRLVHRFWGTKMALSSPVYSTAELTRTKGEMEAFLADTAKLEKTRALLADDTAGLSAADKTTLAIFERTFGCYIMESAEALTLREECTSIEGGLEAARNQMSLGAVLDGRGFVEMSSVGLRSKMRVDADPAVRQACWEGLRTIGDFVTSNGFVELIKARNAMAKSLGYADYYDYKVTQAEGFGKEALFEILDTLEAGTRPLMLEARARLAKEKGDSALEPWNSAYMMAGSITKQLDPYFPFEKAIEQWGRSFAALGISYAGAEMSLDLLDRKGKYSNGFCHWPQPAWVKPDGSWQPTVTHFTSLADPSAIGSGYTALNTLMHEAGHAAHFANIRMPSPLFAQERAPTSVPYAELQSMFLDALVGDAAWRGRYAVSRDGEALPWALHEADKRANHPYEVLALRAMIAVPYYEKALYEMPEAELSAASIAKLADEIEVSIQGGLSARPLLSVPHLLSDEASCYYHGYVLAEMAIVAISALSSLLPPSHTFPSLPSQLRARGDGRPPDARLCHAPRRRHRRQPGRRTDVTRRLLAAGQLGALPGAG